MTTETGLATAETAANLAAPFLDLLPISGIALSVINRTGQQSIIHASDDTAGRLIEIQFDLGEGPLFSAFSTAEVELHPHAVASCFDRWPTFCGALALLDVESLFAFPLMVGAATVGVAVAYRASEGTLDPAEVERGMSLAKAIGGLALDRALSFADAESTSALNPPLEMRRVIHQATGMILAQLDSTATDALLRLQAYAFSHNRAVRDVALNVVQRELDFSLLPEL